jgi:hypothetical protein
MMISLSLLYVNPLLFIWMEYGTDNAYFVAPPNCCYSHRMFERVHGDLLDRLLDLIKRILKNENKSYHSNGTTADSSERSCSSFLNTTRSISTLVVLLVGIIVSFPVGFVQFIYNSGPFASVVLSLWRLWVRDFGDAKGDEGKANLTPALIIFYALVPLQGAIFSLWYLGNLIGDEIILSVYRRCQMC